MKTLSQPHNLRRKMLALTVILLSVIFSGCENSTAVSDAQISEIDFRLVVLDENDVEGVDFEPGTDIKVALKLINNSGQELEWRYDYTCMLFQSEDFLLVYKRDESNETDASYFPVGTPYQGPINCPTINLTERIPPGESLIIKLSWSDNPDNNNYRPVNIIPYQTLNSKSKVRQEVGI